MAFQADTSELYLDTVTNQLLDDFPVHCHFRDGVIGQDHRHSHRGYEIYVCLQGEGRLLVGDRVYTLQPGMLVIMRPHVLHWARVSGTKPIHRFVLSIDENYIHSWVNTMPAIADCLHSLFIQSESASLHWQLSVSKVSSIQHTLVQLAREIADKPPYYESAMIHLLGELFVLLAREQITTQNEYESNTGPLHLAERILQYFADHYAEPIEVSRLNVQFNVSRSHMYVHFKQWTGHSVNRYLTLLRIDHAKRLLMDTPLSVTEVASAVGFNDLSHFYHTFKTETRMTPNEHRKRHRKITTL